MSEDDLVDPPDPAVWEGAMRCEICGHIEVHANHAAALSSPETTPAGTDASEEPWAEAAMWAYQFAGSLSTAYDFEEGDIVPLLDMLSALAEGRTPPVEWPAVVPSIARGDKGPFASVTTPAGVLAHAGTTTDCPLEGVHEHAFRGPHRFHVWEPAGYRETQTPCPVCPHWMEVHNPDGTCGCGAHG